MAGAGGAVAGAGGAGPAGGGLGCRGGGGEICWVLASEAFIGGG